MTKPIYVPLCKECGETEFNEDEYGVHITCDNCGKEYTIYDWYDEPMEILSKAMLRAKQAFDEYINNELEMDGSYFNLKLEGEITDIEYTPMNRLFMDFNINVELGD